MKRRSAALFLTVLAVFFSCSVALAYADTQTYSTNMTWGYGNGNYVGFITEVTCSGYPNSPNQVEVGSTLYWNFTNLHVGSKTTAAFYVSTEDADLTLYQVDYTFAVSGTVSGAGTQSFYMALQPYKVYIDEAEAPMGTGWSYAANLITITAATKNFVIAYSSDAVPYPNTPEGASNLAINNTLAAALVVALIPFVILVGAVFTVLRGADSEVLLTAVIVTIVVAVLLVVVVFVAAGVSNSMSFQ